MIEAVRWLFLVLALATLLLGASLPIRATDPTIRLVGTASCVVLALSWMSGYLRQNSPWALDLLDAAAFLGFAMASLPPTAVLGFMLPALWFRSLYGSASHAAFRGIAYATALVLLLPLWPEIPGHVGATDVNSGLWFGIVPTMFANVVVGQYLAKNLRARAEGSRRDSIQSALGSELLGITGTMEIIRIAWVGLAAICAATPGLRVMRVARVDNGLRVERAVGGYAGIPSILPLSLLSLSEGSAEATVANHVELDAAVGTPCAWACVPLPAAHALEGQAWMLVGSPRILSEDALISVRGLINQVTLALHSSDVHQALTVQATLDSLTGLANRTSFNLALAAVLEGHGPEEETTVLFADLDDFKDVNDVFGHRAGDDVLREVAARLLGATRPDDLCARLGGDEFGVLLRRTGPAVAIEVARRIVSAVGAAVHLGAEVAQVGVSVGVATAGAGSDVESMIHCADVAMYAAKAKGKARVQIYEATLLQRDSSQASFERQLAAAATNGELVVHYQPVLSLPDLQCIAVEALVRWQHPDQGLLAPGDFIDAAERIGAIAGIGTFVLNQACRDAVLWRAAHPRSPLAMHVNVSPLQLDDAGFTNTVTRSLAASGLAAEQLVLEITESVVISSPVAIERLRELAALGVTIAIDDFGTGYSALTTLRTLPAQIVKIDRSFVAGSTLNPEDRAVVEAVVKMAKQMGLRTIAEGVERVNQEMFLKSIGADAVQGYLYLRPASAAEFGAWLDAQLRLPRPTHTGDVVLAFKPRNIA